MFGFECDCSIDVDNGPAVSTSVFRLARVRHRCCECDRIIEPKEKYEYASGCWDGHWHSYKTCLGCYRIRQRFCSSGWYYGGLAEQIWSCLGYDYREEPSELSSDDLEKIELEDTKNRESAKHRTRLI